VIKKLEKLGGHYASAIPQKKSLFLLLRFLPEWQKRLDWFGREKLGGTKEIGGRNDVDEVDMYEGGGGSCCILSIYNHSSNFLSLLCYLVV